MSVSRAAREGTTNMSEEQDAPNLQEHWNTFSTKIRLLSELESHNNQNIRDTLSNHKMERFFPS